MKSVFLLLLAAITVCQALNKSLVYREDLAKKLLVYSSISYCANESTIEAWTCDSCHEDLKFTIEAAVNDNITETFGFVGRTEIDGEESILVSFRGTSRLSVKQITTNLLALHNPEDAVCDGCYTHAGFSLAWSGLRSSLMRHLKRLTALFEVAAECDSRFPAKPKIYFTGHSLGGALAARAVSDVVLNETLPGHTIHLYTFGAPKIANGIFLEAVAKKTEEVWWIQNVEDPIKDVPSTWAFSTPLGFQWQMMSRVIRYYNSRTPNTTHYEEIDPRNLPLENWTEWPDDPEYLFHRIYLGVNVGGHCSNMTVNRKEKFAPVVPRTCGKTSTGATTTDSTKDSSSTVLTAVTSSTTLSTTVSTASTSSSTVASSTTSTSMSTTLRITEKDVKWRITQASSASLTYAGILAVAAATALL